MSQYNALILADVVIWDLDNIRILVERSIWDITNDLNIDFIEIARL